MELKKIEDIQDLVVTVMGLGRYKQGSGVGAAKWLLRHGAQIIVTDLKSEGELKPSVDLISEWYTKYRDDYPDRSIYAPLFNLGGHQEEDFTNVQLVVKNPDVPKTSDFLKLAKEAGITVESDVSLFFHFYPHPIYAVTGTRGKSTTTALFGKMLSYVNEKAVIAGNIMHSPLEELDWMLIEEGPTPVALELSSWLLESLENVTRGPEIAVFTNVSKDHLDRYDSFESYIDAKALMFKHQTPNQMAVLNLDDDIVKQVGDERVTSKKYWVTSKGELPKGLEGAFVNEAGDLILRLEGNERKICHVSNWPALQGEHNVQNALSATVAAALAGVSDEGLCSALRTFEGLEGRQQTVREYDGVTYVNDTTATTSAGTNAALKRFGTDQKHLVLIIGGKSKGDDYTELGQLVQKFCKHVVYLEGSHTSEIVTKIGPDLPHDYVNTMQDAVVAAQKAASKGDVVLLSPAGSSFDLFENEFDRGGQFVEAVKNLKGE